MLTAAGLLVGFAFAANTADECSTFVVNLCGHDSVGAPLARSMNAVDAEYIAHHGVDNLIIPISVSEPKKTKREDYAYCVDVVVHTLLIKMCTPQHHLFQHLTEKLVRLAIEWIRNECGVQLLPRTCRIAGNPLYFSDTVGIPVDEITKEAINLFQRKSSSSESHKEEQNTIPDVLNLMKSHVPEPKQPLVCEVISTPGIKKGFLVNGSARLYGPDGSGEGSGNAPDPLGHIPQSLRDKCQIIDTRSMEQLPCLPVQTLKPDDKTPKLHPSSMLVASTTKPKGKDEGNWSRFSIEHIEEKVVIRFLVPDTVASLRDIDLSATTDTLEINGNVIQLPVSIVTDDVRAKFVKATRMLIVTCLIDVS
ncbi:pre-RNA_processing_PIH1/Nop17 (plasmid) [Leishmania braziliensis MHOM/BR/75/M2904]|nr:pre-RNA_processing_PIH1/Nop17 [Leishmania braziliensis MHOM/BR/75/M2904]